MTISANKAYKMSGSKLSFKEWVETQKMNADGDLQKFLDNVSGFLDKNKDKIDKTTSTVKKVGETGKGLFGNIGLSDIKNIFKKGDKVTPTAGTDNSGGGGGDTSKSFPTWAKYTIGAVVVIGVGFAVYKIATRNK